MRFSLASRVFFFSFPPASRRSAVHIMNQTVRRSYYEPDGPPFILWTRRTMQRNWKKVAKSPKIEISRIGPCPISLESYDHWLLTSGIYFAFKNIFNPFFGGWKWSIFMIFQKVPNLQGKYRVSQYKKINFSTKSG